jgi:hypothetical protein
LALLIVCLTRTVTAVADDWLALGALNLGKLV